MQTLCHSAGRSAKTRKNSQNQHLRVNRYPEKKTCCAVGSEKFEDDWEEGKGFYLPG